MPGPDGVEKQQGDDVADAGAAAEEEGDFFYVCKRVLDEVREKLKKGEDISQGMMNDLAFPDGLEDDELMVPVDMSAAGGNFDDVEQMIDKLGPKGAAEAFIKAFDHFEKNKESIPKDERPTPMTAKEWKAVLEANDMEGEEEDLEGEEEELLEGEEEEDEGKDDAEVEPAFKKAKTE
mmetsp:Transcript_40294/g.111907  ORF Transcript_40294/g.111907 Transcript_40294/m.111907 type:complete len:178 (-) Transcript_40294:149-682(-)